MDESLLTGESVPVRKTPSESAQSLERPGGDDLPSVFSGSLVTTGQGIAEAVNTGGRTELGKIGNALQQIQSEPTTLQKETGRLVRTLAFAGLAACAVVVVTYLVTRGGSAQVWKEGLLAGIAMAMAILPEEFPVVLTVFLALGAWRISRSRVLTRRMPAIETLGAATVLCVDKTGTLTLNQMSLKTLAVDGRTTSLGADAGDLSEEFHALLENAILASKRDPFDPMELALQTAGDRLLMRTEHLHPTWSLLREYRDSESMLVKAQLAAKIAEILQRRALTQARAAEVLGLSQPKVSALLKGRFRGISEHRLLECLTRLGRDVHIVIKPTPRSRPNGRLTLSVA